MPIFRPLAAGVGGVEDDGRKDRRHAIFMLFLAGTVMKFLNS